MNYPLYRLHKYGQNYSVVILPTSDVVYSPDGDWSNPVLIVELARTTSREAGMAVLRLHGVKEFQDWTKPGHKGWDEPCTQLS
jgi:hypothetical protein